MCIDRIIDHGPTYGAQIQRSYDLRVQFVAYGRVAEDRAIVECQASKDLNFLGF